VGTSLPALQTEYSLVERAPENEILATCEELGIGFVPWGPTHRAFLTGVINENTRFSAPDRRASVPTFTPEALKANMLLLAQVREWAKRKSVTPAQFALGWLLAESRGSRRFQGRRNSSISKRTSPRLR
jgi:aryl-alcohol dehydrogenase-like predicted oxidoreductase